MNLIWLRNFISRDVSFVRRNVVVFAFFLLLSFIFWYLNSLGKESEGIISYPVRYINLPEGWIMTGDPPSKLQLYLKGPGYSIVRLRLTGNNDPLEVNISDISYRKETGNRKKNFFMVTSVLIPDFMNQLKDDCRITSVKPDTLFFLFERRRSGP